MAAAAPVLLALTAAQGVMNFSANRKAAANARAQGEYEGNVLEQNADLADLAAADATARGITDENQVRGTVRKVLGSQRAAYAAQGIDLSSGSVGDVAADTALMGELDALTIRNNAMREAWGYKVEAAQTRDKAKYARQAGRQGQSAGNMAAVGSLLTAGSEITRQRLKK
jgi:hypothetical protein